MQFILLLSISSHSRTQSKGRDRQRGSQVVSYTIVISPCLPLLHGPTSWIGNATSSRHQVYMYLTRTHVSKLLWLGPPRTATSSTQRNGGSTCSLSPVQSPFSLSLALFLYSFFFLLSPFPHSLFSSPSISVPFCNPFFFKRITATGCVWGGSMMQN